MASAGRAGATCFITNDARVRGRTGVEIVRLSDVGFGLPEERAGAAD
ncbi:MAG: hypothetical protein AB1Z67_11385 [Candidatus Limnocylindrales bacterium]